jgi:hypothetical protein
MPDTDKVRENKARRWAARLGYRMCKSRAKMVHANDHGLYQLRDDENNPRWGWSYDIDLETVESILADIEREQSEYEGLKSGVYRKAKATGLWPTWNPGASWQLKDPSGQTVARGNMRELNEYLDEQAAETVQ